MPSDTVERTLSKPATPFVISFFDKFRLDLGQYRNMMIHVYQTELDTYIALIHLMSANSDEVRAYTTTTTGYARMYTLKNAILGSNIGVRYGNSIFFTAYDATDPLKHFIFSVNSKGIKPLVGSLKQHNPLSTALIYVDSSHLFFISPNIDMTDSWTLFRLNLKTNSVEKITEIRENETILTQLKKNGDYTVPFFRGALHSKDRLYVHMAFDHVAILPGRSRVRQKIFQGLLIDLRTRIKTYLNEKDTVQLDLLGVDNDEYTFGLIEGYTAYRATKCRNRK